MRQRNNDEDGEAFAKRLKVTPLSKPTMPLDEIVHLRTMQSHRNEDPEWFEGCAIGNIDCVHEMYQTKESYFIAKCQRRRSKYWKEFRDKLKKERNQMLSLVIKNFDEELEKLFSDQTEQEIHNGYFNRKSIMRICDESGKFSCSPYDGTGCNQQHFTNPYANREQRFWFKLWELDHKYVLHTTPRPR